MYIAEQVVTDGTRGGDTVVDVLMQAKVPVMQVHSTSINRAALMPLLILCFERHGVVIPHDPRLPNSPRALRTTPTARRHIQYAAASGATDDFIIALALALDGANPPTVAFAASGRPPFLIDHGPRPTTRAGSPLGERFCRRMVRAS